MPAFDAVPFLLLISALLLPRATRSLLAWVYVFAPERLSKRALKALRLLLRNNEPRK